MIKNSVTDFTEMALRDADIIYLEVKATSRLPVSYASSKHDVETVGGFLLQMRQNWNLI